MKTVIGLSGGVDSALAAYMLKKEGHELTGVYLDIGDSYDAAARTAAELGIPLEKVDISAQLEDMVCAPFTEAYVSGRTPNPCLLCNPLVKFPALLAAADRVGAEKIATGHYARVKYLDGSYRLFQAESSNDQSYMLCMLGQDILSRLVLPLGELEKSEARRLAADASLSSSSRPDSMEICFIPDNDYASFIEKRCGALPPGDFVDKNGKVLGRHEGIHRYTVGQRRGLRFAAGERVYVAAINAEDNTVLLTGEAGLITGEFSTWAPHWISGAPSLPLKCCARVRHQKTLTPVTVYPGEAGLTVRTDAPIRRPSPGQTAAFYLDGEVLGGAEIK